MRVFFQKLYMGWYFSALIICVIILLPLFVLFINNININSEIWSHIYENLLLEYVLNTLSIIVPVSLLSIIISFFSAYYVSFYKIPFKGVFDVLLILPLSIPSYIIAYTYSYFFSYSGGFYSFQNLLGMDSYFTFNFFEYWVLIIILTISLYPYLYISYRAFFETLPLGIVYTYRSLSLSKFSVIRKILFPLSRPAMVSGLFLIIMELLNEYGAVKYFGIKTFTVGIFRIWLGMGSLSSALNLSFYLFSFVIVLMFLEKIFRGKKSFELRRNTNEVNKLEIFKSNSLLIFICIIILISFIIPLSIMISNSLKLNDYSYYSEIFNSMFNTFTIGILSSLLILIFSLIVLFNKEFNNNKFLNLLVRFASSGYSIPGAVIAISCLFFFSYLNEFYYFKILNSGIILLIYALIIRFLAVSYNNLKSGSDSLGKTYLNTYRSLGFSSFKSLILVYLPLQKKYIISALLLVFVDVSKELPLTLILRPFNFDTLATRTYDFAGDEMLMEASLPALLIVSMGVLSIIFFKRLNK